jgi:PAS domain S-box-containing protein
LGNEQTERVFGQPFIPSASIAEYREWQLFHPDGRAYHPEDLPLIRAITNGEVTTAQEMMVLRPDGAWRSLEVNAAPIRDPDGRVTAAVVVFTDITERRYMEALLAASEQRYRNLVELTTDIIYISDGDGNQTFMNDAGYRLLEAAPQEVIDQPWLKWVHPDDREATLKAFHDQLALGTDIFGFENRYVAKSGKVIPVLHNVRVLRDDRGAAIGAQGIARDITQRKKAEQLREEYVSLISHDLRSPLTIVLGTASLLRQWLDEKGLAHQASSAATIVDSAKRMAAMIQDLVESARLESGRLALQQEPTDLAQLVFAIVGRMGTAADRDRIIVDAPKRLPPVAVDRERIERVIVNLLANALKYSAPETPVTLLLDERGTAVVAAVSDQGVGIPPEDIPHLFQRYYRARTGRKAEGLGLGLYIARLIVEAHGGQIWVESEPGRGSTFTLTLPLA